MKSISERFWWMNREELQIKCLAYSFVTITRHFAKTRSMNIKKWTNCQSSVRHISEENLSRMKRRRDVEMFTRREFHLHHHQNFPEDEFWSQILIIDLISFSLIISLSLIISFSLIISLSLIILIRNSLIMITLIVFASNIFIIVISFSHISSKRKTVRWTVRWILSWTVRWTIRWTVWWTIRWTIRWTVSWTLG